jgi:hypothetical protein
MNHPPSPDDVLAYVRAADPLPEMLPRDADASEAVLQQLLAHGPGPASPSVRARHRARWWAVRLAPVAGLAAAGAVVVALLPSSGPVTVPEASAKQILRHALTAVAGSDGAILHAKVTITQSTPSTGWSRTWTIEDWQQVDSPYNDREITTDVWPEPVEMATVQGMQWLYDPGTNRIYTNDPTPAFTLTAGPRPGTYTLQAGSGAHASGPTTTVTAHQAAKLRAGTDEWADDGHGGLLVIPVPTTGGQNLSSFRDQATALLHAPNAQVTRTTVDGQSVLQVTAPGSTRTYDINPTTYAPVQMYDSDAVPASSANPHSNELLKWTDWQYLTGSAADPALLSLPAQHTTATIDDSAADYTAAENRLLK